MSSPLSPLRQQASQIGLDKPDAYNPYAAGAKLYGAGRPYPTSGPVNKEGYVDRDRQMAAKRNALLQSMQRAQSGNYMSSPYLGGPQ